MLLVFAIGSILILLLGVSFGLYSYIRFEKNVSIAYLIMQSVFKLQLCWLSLSIFIAIILSTF